MHDAHSTPTPRFSLPLRTDFTAATGGTAIVDGAYRFVSIADRSGYQSLSRHTTLRIPIDQHLHDRGSILISICPTESLGVSPVLPHVEQKLTDWQEYGLLADTPRTNDIDGSVFAWYWRNAWHPQMIAKFAAGAAGGGAADYGVRPYVPVEHLPLHEHRWYRLALTWDKPASRLRIFVDGILCGTTSYDFVAETPHPALYLGNTAMVFADLDVYDTELSSPEVASLVDADADTAGVRDELLELFTITPKPLASWRPTEDWERVYERTLTQPDDFADWRQEGCLEPPFELRELSISDSGLTIQTPDQIDIESRVYFWSPQRFEGDVAVEFEFRPESTTGLALLVAQATGMHGEDFLVDDSPRTTGSMATIISDSIRNYHWEFYRKAVDVRGDLGTHILAKNPWYKPLGMSTTEPLTRDEWHRLIFVQEGPRLRAGLDGEWVLDVTDDPFTHSGPVLRGGRIALRLMYGTRMTFRNLVVHERTVFRTVR